MKNSKGISIAALVCAIVGIVLTFFLGSLNPTTNLIYAIIEIALCILGIILGAKGMKMAAAEGQGKGMAVAGLVIGIVGTVFAFGNLICAIACASAVSSVENAMGDLEGLESNLNDLANQLENLE